MKRETIQTDTAPAAIGPYSQAVRVGDTVYISGQIPLDPASMELVSGDIRAHVTRVFDNLEALSRSAGGELKDIVKLTIFLTDLGNFGLVNEVMSERFTAPYPARAAIGVASLPKGAQVEMEAILVPGSG